VKQEILTAVAMILLSYNFKFVEWVNVFSKGKETKFPRTKRGFVGNGVVTADGDMKVGMERKPSSLS
jgi:hypothetical protein